VLFLHRTGDTTYTVILVAENNCGFDTAYHSITVFPNDIDAFFNTDVTQGCAPLTVTATNLTNAPFSAFGFGNSTTAITMADTATHTYFEPGIYWLEHYVNNGCSADTDSVMITVFPDPEVGVVPKDTTVCPDTPITFVDTMGSVNKSPYLWDMGNGDTLNVISPTYSYDQSGAYQVVLQVFSTLNGCSAKDTVNITISPRPVVSFVPSDSIGCEDLTVVFANTTTAPSLSFNWDFGDGNSANLSNPQHTYTLPGTYTVTLSGFDAQGCGGSSSVSMVVNPQPVSAFSYQLDDSCGVPATATFGNLSTGNPIAYFWDFGDGGSSTLTDPVHSYQSPGIYTVQLISETAFGCQDTSEQTLDGLSATSGPNRGRYHAWLRPLQCAV
jgi:PKD repeat protein